MSSLFQDLGGGDAVAAVAETFYRRVLVDDRIARFFDDVDMDRQLAKQTAFLTMAFGGPHGYSGKDLRSGHRHLVANGLNDAHVDAVVELLGQSLRDHGAAEPLIAQVVEIAESVRSDVLGRDER